VRRAENNPQKQGREVKKRLLVVVFALIVLTFIALLAFLPSVFGIHPKPALVTATTPPSVPVAKIPSPTAKTTAMGTPAQFIEDLNSVGFDLAGASFTKPELLARASQESSSESNTYRFKNACIEFDADTHEFYSIEIFSPLVLTPPIPVSVKGGKGELPSGLFSALFSGDRDKVLARYGTAYRRGTGKSLPDALTYFILSENGTSRLWRVMIQVDANSKVKWLSAWVLTRNPFRLQVTSGKGAMTFSGEGTELYSDLVNCGLTLGMPSPRLALLARGEALRNAAGEVTRYEYPNGSVSLDPKSGRLTSFYIKEDKTFSAENIRTLYKSTLQGKALLRAGKLQETFRNGPVAVTKRYGVIGSSSPPSKIIRYYFILDDGSKLQTISITFSYYDSNSSILGESILYNPLYTYTPPASPKPK
jgi:hypothetical protein